MCIHAVEAPGGDAAAFNAVAGRRAAGEDHARGEAHVCVCVRAVGGAATIVGAALVRAGGGERRRACGGGEACVA